MALYARLIWCFALLTFVSGCATYQSASLPGHKANNPPPQDETSMVKIGAGVRVTLLNGDTVTGEVVQVSETEIVVDSFGNFGIDRRSFSMDDIQKIETENYSKSEERFAKTAAISIGIVFVGLALIAYSLRGLGEMN